MSANELSSRSSESGGKSTAAGSPSRLWPAGLCWLLMLLLTVSGICIMEHQRTFRAGMTLETSIVSFVLAQFALATMIGGLVARSWIVSWCLAVFLASLHTTVVTVAVDFREWSVDSTGRRLALCAVFPALFLSTCAPLVVLRTLWGWTLSRQPEIVIQRTRPSLEDIILLGVVIACSITLAQFFFHVEGRGAISELLLIMGIFAAISFVCVPPVVYVTFGVQSWLQRIVGWLLLSLVALGMVFASNMVMQGGLRNAIDDLPYMFIGVPVGCATVCIGVLSLIASGYRLTRFASRTSQSPEVESRNIETPEIETYLDPALQQASTTSRDSWLEDETPSRSSQWFTANAQLQARVATAGMVLLAGITGFIVQGSHRRAMQLNQQLREAPIELAYLEKKSVLGLQFAPTFVDADLNRFTRYSRTLSMLSFHGTQITDALLPQLNAFPNLYHLDLSTTAISDSGARSLQLQDSVKIVKLSDTGVSWNAARQLADRTNIDRLELSGLGITDQQLGEPIKVKGLGLARNPISDQGIESLLKNQPLKWLDLSDTPVTGKSLSSVTPSTLILDGTQIDDANLLAILSTGRIMKLSIARTQITAAVLPKLSSLAVRFGEGLITERDLAALKFISLVHLGLNAKQFDGSCLLAGNISTQSLDLSDSSVTDGVLISVLGNRYYQYLGLANTSVTDAALPYIYAAELDLRGTKVTAAGILGRPQYGRIIVNHDQFTPADMAKLQTGRFAVASHPQSDAGFGVR